MKTKLWAMAVMAAACVAPAYADNYDFKFIDNNGNVLSSGSLSTGSTVNNINYFGTPYQAQTITTMNGLFMGDAINFVPNPFAPASFQHGNIYADNQFLLNGPGTLEGYGLVFDTANHGIVNFGGDYVDVGRYGYFGIYNDGRSRYVEGTFQTTRVAGNTTVAGGTSTAPVALTSQVTGIAGSIGPTNPEQFYSFDWAGGFFSSTANIGNAAATDIFGFSLAGFGSGSPFQRQAVQLDASNNFSGTLSFNLAAGRYLLGLTGVVPTNLAAGNYLALDASASTNANFTINFNAPVGGATAPVPEPATWAMMITGFIGMGGMLRRRRTGEAPAVA